jgi:hypothetical protein
MVLSLLSFFLDFEKDGILNLFFFFFLSLVGEGISLVGDP